MLSLLLAVAALGLAVTSTASAAAPARKLQMTVTIKKFVADRSGVSALGTAAASVGGRTTQRAVSLAVSRSTRCTVLSLSLQNLRLQLLGLNLVASPINLHITGDRGGTLGALFCRLAGGLKLSSLASGRAAARSLNSRLATHPMRVIGVSARLIPHTAQVRQAAPPAPAPAPAPAASCDVLDLVLGPLNLNLLGLVVDLYGPTTRSPVEVHVTANPAGGILGSVFCKLASGQAVG